MIDDIINNQGTTGAYGDSSDPRGAFYGADVNTCFVLPDICETYMTLKDDMLALGMSAKLAVWQSAIVEAVNFLSTIQTPAAYWNFYINGNIEMLRALGFYMAYTVTQDPAMLQKYNKQFIKTFYPNLAVGANEIRPGVAITNDKYSGTAVVAGFGLRRALTLTISPGTTGGTFRLRYKGSAWSTPIAYNAAANYDDNRTRNLSALDYGPDPIGFASVGSVLEAVTNLSTVGTRSSSGHSLSNGWVTLGSDPRTYFFCLPGSTQPTLADLEVDDASLTGTSPGATLTLDADNASGRAYVGECGIGGPGLDWNYVGLQAEIAQRMHKFIGSPEIEIIFQQITNMSMQRVNPADSWEYDAQGGSRQSYVGTYLYSNLAYLTMLGINSTYTGLDLADMARHTMREVRIGLGNSANNYRFIGNTLVGWIEATK